MTHTSTFGGDPRLAPWHGPFPLVHRLPEAARSRLAGLTARVTFAAGEVVLPEGIVTPYLGTVIAGRVALRLHVPERGGRTILTLEGGDLLGWSALVPPYRTTSLAVAVEATELAILEAATLRSALEEDAALAAAIYPAVLAAVAERLGTSRQQLLDLFRGTSVEPW